MPGGDAVSQARLPAMESEAPATSPGFRAIDKAPSISDREPRNPAVRVAFLVNPTNTARVAAFAVNRRRPESL